MNADVSVIIVSWNTREILACCLDALWSGTRAQVEVIVVDNASSDGTPDVLDQRNAGRERFRLVRNEDNIGFPKAVNQGLELATAPFVLLLNPDLVLQADALDRMLTVLKTRPEVGAVGPKIRFPEGPIQYHCARRLPFLLDFVASRFGASALLPRLRLPNQLMTDWDHQDSRQVECLSGACMMLRTAELRSLGGLIERMYLEDSELCWQVRNALGKQVHYLAEAEGEHHHSASYRSISDRKHYMWVAGRLESAYLEFFALHGGCGTMIVARSASVVSGMVKLLVLAPLLALFVWHARLRKRTLRALYRSCARLLASVRCVDLQIPG